MCFPKRELLKFRKIQASKHMTLPLPVATHRDFNTNTCNCLSIHQDFSGLQFLPKLFPSLGSTNSPAFLGYLLLSWRINKWSFTPHLFWAPALVLICHTTWPFKPTSFCITSPHLQHVNLCSSPKPSPQRRRSRFPFLVPQSLVPLGMQLIFLWWMKINDWSHWLNFRLW